MTGSSGTTQLPDFTAVDETAEPETFVRYLDKVSRAADLRQLKLQTFSLLALRPGDRVLDVGCGVGDDVRALATLVGPDGSAVGIDNSRHLISVAQERSLGRERPGTFQVGDAERLAFADASFEACRAERVLQHVSDPAAAVGEMIRVLRPDGRLVCFEPDWELQVIDASDRGLTRRIRDYRADRIRSGWVGRALRGLFLDGGLSDVRMTPIAGAVTDLAVADATMDIRGSLAEATENGVVTAEDADRWWADIEACDRAGHFLAVSVAFLVVGRKPST